MIKRHVFLTPSLAVAEAVSAAARSHGIDEKSIRLEARPDVEIRRINDDKLNVSMDFIPAGVRGAVGGAIAGFVAGMLAMWIPFFGLSLGGVAALTVVGALVGIWTSVLVGSAIPDEVRRMFADQIEAGNILVVVDCELADFGPVETSIADAGGQRLAYEATTALT